MSKIVAQFLGLLALFVIHSDSVGAQQPDRPPSLSLGDAIVTGFSGTIAPDPAQPRSANKSAIDLTFINPDGPSARVVGVGRPGYVWDGRLFQAPKTFDVFAKDTGQVFGVALDDQAAPNIYLAATSAFGLNLIGRGRDGMPERRKVGGPGTGWMKGQFGLDLQGGPGSIYKVDGTTGVVSLLANVMLDGVPNPGPGLGGLTYDAAHKQLFVSDLYTGMIHRVAVGDGSEPGPPYNHGVTGRSAANLAPVPFNPGNRPNIASSRFNTQNPDTWGFAAPERRVWGLAVQVGRLFYSARNGAATDGPQIWSVGIQQDGSFAPDARWELDVAPQPGPYPVSDIAFSQRGAMILAQRASIAASYDYSAFTRPGEPRVLRYWLKDPNDPPSPGRWKPVAEEYAIGFAGNYRNTNGGVALGYGYDADGTLSTGACEVALWSTGQNLRNAPALRNKLEPGGPLLVNGLQGNPADMVRPANEPPWTSYFIDYDDRFDDPGATGHLGSVRVLVQPCAGSAADRPVPAVGPPDIGGPGGGPVGGCIGPDCPPPPPGCRPPMVRGAVVGLPVGEGPADGRPVVERPADGRPTVRGPVEGPCICPPGTVLRGERCVPQECPPTMVRNADGQCVCSPRTVLRGERCVPQECPPTMVPNADGKCVCSPGTVPRGERCVPQECPPTMVRNADGKCVCRRGTVLRGQHCVPRIQREQPRPATPPPESRPYEGPPLQPSFPPPQSPPREPPRDQQYEGPQPSFPFPQGTPRGTPRDQPNIPRQQPGGR